MCNSKNVANLQCLPGPGAGPGSTSVLLFRQDPILDLSSRHNHSFKQKFCSHVVSYYHNHDCEGADQIILARKIGQKGDHFGTWWGKSEPFTSLEDLQAICRRSANAVEINKLVI